MAFRKTVAASVVMAVIAVALVQTAAAAISIETEVGTTYILWRWNCTDGDAENTTVNVSVDGVLVLEATKASGSYLLTDLEPNELHVLEVVNCTNESDAAVSVAKTLPPFSLFVVLLLITFCFLGGVFVAPSSSARILLGIFGIAFGFVTQKYSTLYAPPLSHLLLLVVFFMFVLIFVDAITSLARMRRRKPSWEEEFWSQSLLEGGGDEA